MNSGKPKKIGTIPFSSLPELDNKKDYRYFEGKSDLDIWRMFREGNEGAFRYIYDTYLIELFRYGTHFTNDRELIKDCIHDLFVELRQGKRISDTDCIKFYLLKAFRWKINHLLAYKDKLSLLAKKATVFHTDIEASCETILINAQFDDETLLQLNKALSRLTDRQKEALFHFYHKDLSYAQVAEIMELSNIKSARNLIYKALDTLKVYYHQIR